MNCFRFDGRGHLYNLTEYEARPGLSGEVRDDLERHEEELCEEEREDTVISISLWLGEDDI